MAYFLSLLVVGKVVRRVLGNLEIRLFPEKYEKHGIDLPLGFHLRKTASI